MDYGTLPKTGAALTVGGIWFGWWGVLAAVLGVVLVAATMLRVSFRPRASIAGPLDPRRQFKRSSRRGRR